MIALLHTILCTYFLISFSRGDVIYVSTNGTTNADCGSSDNPCDSLKAAQGRVTKLDTIALLPGIYDGEKNRGLLVQGMTLSISSSSGSFEDTIVDLEYADIGFNVGPDAQLILKGITFQHGSSQVGGMVITSAGNISISSCQFLSSDAQAFNFTIGGSAVEVKSAASVQIVNTIFADNRMHSAENQTRGFGGGLHFEDIQVAIIENCRFVHNHALLGGAIYANNVGVDNHVWGLNITNCLFESNFAADSGGDLFLQNSYTYTQQTNFTGSIAYGLGGALLMTGGSFRCDHCNLQNTSASRGGALANDNSGSIRIMNSEVENCLASHGGGVYLSGGGFRAINSTLASNRAKGYGGAIYLAIQSVGRLENVTLSDNYADGGGAVALFTRAEINMTDVLFSENHAGDAGGAAYCSDSFMYIYNTRMVPDYANNSDADIYCSTIPSYTYCTVRGDSEWASLPKCGDHTDEDGGSGGLLSNLKNLPVPAIIGIALGAAAVVMFIVMTIVCVSWKRKAKLKEQIFKKVGITKSDTDDLELLEDYDE